MFNLGMRGTLHIIGAGLAGLSCALHAQKMGYRIKIYEASPQSGGRIRSIHDKINNCTYDNGTHLIIGGYRYSFEYLDLIGARDQLYPLEPATFSFHEPGQALSWQLPARNLLGYVLKGHVPGVDFHEIWTIFQILCIRHNASLDQILNDRSESLKRFWEPLILAVFNCQVNEVSVKILKQTLWELTKAGPSAFTPYFAKKTLSECFIEPAIKSLDIEYSNRLLGYETNATKVEILRFKKGEIVLDEGDKVVFALPPQAYAQINSGLFHAEFTYNPITNVHFFLQEAISERFIGLIGTQSQWVYAQDKHICVTISDDEPSNDCESVLFAENIWYEIAPSLGLPPLPTPKNRIIVEKFATPVQNKTFAQLRPKTKTAFSNLFLCGDWIETKLPATIESAIKSGKMAAQAMNSV